MKGEMGIVQGGAFVHREDSCEYLILLFRILTGRGANWEKSSMLMECREKWGL